MPTGIMLLGSARLQTPAPSTLPSDSAPRPAGATPAAAPRIVALATTPEVVHAGDTVRWDVRTSPDVSAVTARVATYGFTFVRVAPGHFSLAFAIPQAVPFFFHGDYHLAVLAVAPAGDAHADATLRFR